MFTSIKHTILISQVSAVLLVGLILGFTSYTLTRDYLLDAQQNYLEAMAKDQSEEIQNLLSNKIAMMERISTSKEMAEYLFTDEELPFLEYLLQLENEFPVLSFVAKSGKEEIKTVSGSSSDHFLEIGDRTYFDEAKATPYTVIVPPVEWGSDLNEPVVNLLLAKFGHFADDYAGVLLGSVPVAQITEGARATQIGVTGFCTITDKQGNVLASPQQDYSTPLIPLQGEGTQGLVAYSQAQKEGFARATLFGDDSFIAFAPVNRMEWTVMAALPYDEFIEAPKRLRNTVVFVVLSLFLVVAGISYLIARRITHPLLELANASQRISQDDLAVTIEVKTEDEVGILSRSFNQMITNLQTYRRRLISSNQYTESIIASISNALFVVSSEGSIQRVNRSFLMLLGYQEDELLGWPIDKVFPEARELLFSEQGVIKNPARNAETIYISREGKRIPVLFSSSILQRDQDEFISIVGVAQDITERKEAEAQVRHMAYYDNLTGLPNRVLFKERLKQALSLAQRYQRLSALMFLDLDNFKRINDTLGHKVGDLLLKEVADRLKYCVRDSDTVSRLSLENPANTIARLGGDEFTIFLTELQHAEDPARVARRVLSELSRPFVLDGHEVFVTASLGITLSPFDSDDFDSLLKNADTAMYHAKYEGKNNFQFYRQSMNANALEKLELENDLRKALDQEDFLVYFQPQWNTRTGRMVGMEALVRWQHPDKGMVSPADFIPLAEETGLIIPLGEWVLRAACAQNKAWQMEGLPPVRVAVNLSGQQFKKQDLIDSVAQALQKSGLDPKYLELEITESIIMENVTSAQTMLEEFKKMGLRIAMDDFGTGYSSFGNLKLFPMDLIKIDTSFVKDVNSNPDNAAIVNAIIAMARSLKLEIIAEGVETVEQLRFLFDTGCPEVQGFLFSRPLPAEEASALLAREKNGTGVGLPICRRVFQDLDEVVSSPDIA